MKLKPTFEKYFNYILYILYFCTFILILDNKPYGDDFQLVFNDHYLKVAPNFFSFWDPFGEFFKSWSLTYSVLWTLLKTLGENYVYYRFINLTLHFVNYILLSKILDKKFPNYKYNKHLSLLFLFNPLSVLTVSWIFQIKTLLSITFGFLSILFFLKRKKNSFKEMTLPFIFFYLSILSKITTILLPFYFFFKIWSAKDLKKSVILTIPFFILAGFYGLINVKGITNITIEKRIAGQSVTDIDTDHTLTRSEYLRHPDISKKVDLISEFKYSKEYFDTFKKSSAFLEKYAIALQNLGRLVLYTFGMNDYYPIYEDNRTTAQSSFLLFYGMIGTIFIVFLFYVKSLDLILVPILFIPISGLFYIPYMKFSYTSDHWFYPVIIGVLISLKHLLDKIPNKKHYYLYSLMFITGMSYLYTAYKYNSFPSLLTLNAKKYKNAAILEHQITYDNLDKNTAAIISKVITLRRNYNFENPEYLKFLTTFALATNNKNLIHYLYNDNALSILNSKDYRLLQEFSLIMSDKYNKDIAIKTKALDAVNSTRLDQRTYNQLKEVL